METDKRMIKKFKRTIAENVFSYGRGGKRLQYSADPHLHRSPRLLDHPSLHHHQEHPQGGHLLPLQRLHRLVLDHLVPVLV